jgi:hypothetical protein
MDTKSSLRRSVKVKGERSSGPTMFMGKLLVGEKSRTGGSNT